MFYEELAQEAKANSLANLKQNSEMPDLASRSISRDTANELAKKAGIGRSSMTYLIAVYRNRPDLFDGTYTINHHDQSTSVARLYRQYLKPKRLLQARA